MIDINIEIKSGYNNRTELINSEERKRNTSIIYTIFFCYRSMAKQIRNMLNSKRKYHFD